MRSVIMSRALLPVAVAVLIAGAGCAKPAPVVEPPPPALVMPVTPPRVLAPLPDAPPQPTAATAEPEEAPAPARPARPKPRAETRDARPDGAPSPEAPAAEAAPSSPPESKPAEPVLLRTPQTANDAEAERRIRDALGRASRTLSQVNERGLGSDARLQYQSARRFIDQADGALKAGNYMFASYLAEKADALARGLVGR
jgi:hypothetical protein